MSVTYYTISESEFFLGTVMLLNSLRIAGNEGKLVVGKLNIDENPDAARRYDVMSIPTLILFKDGQPVKRLVGAKGKGQLLAEIDEYLR
jgi:thioredoxin 1